MIDQKGGGQNQWLHLTSVTLRSAPADEPFVSVAFQLLL
jgi:hypothetical protein